MDDSSGDLEKEEIVTILRNKSYFGCLILGIIDRKYIYRAKN